MKKTLLLLLILCVSCSNEAPLVTDSTTVSLHKNNNQVDIYLSGAEGVAGYEWSMSYSGAKVISVNKGTFFGSNTFWRSPDDDGLELKNAAEVLLDKTTASGSAIVSTIIFDAKPDVTLTDFKMYNRDGQEIIISK